MTPATATAARSATGALSALAVGSLVAFASYSAGVSMTLLVPAAVAFVALCATRPDLALVVTPLLAPFENHQMPLAGIGALSPIEAAMLAIAAGWAWRALAGQAVVYPSKRDWPVILLVGALLPGLAVGAQVVVVAKLFLMWSAFYIAYLVVQEIEPQRFRWVLAAYAVGAALLGIEGLSNYIAGGGAHLLEGGATAYGRAAGAITDPNYFAAFLQLAAVPALALIVGGKSRRRWLLVPPVLLAFTGILLSLSRGGIIGLGAAVGIVILGWTRSRVVSLALLCVIVAGSVAGLNPFVNARVSEVVSERLTSVTTQSSDNHRFLLWGAAVQITEQHPLFGIGTKAFQEEANRRGLTERGYPLENVHNAYLNIAVEMGLLGAAAFLAWLVRIGRDLLVTLRRRSEGTYPLAVGIAGALVGYCVQALTVSQYRVEIIQATFFLFAGMVAAVARHAESAGTDV